MDEITQPADITIEIFNTEPGVFETRLVFKDRDKAYMFTDSSAFGAAFGAANFVGDYFHKKGLNV